MTAQGVADRLGGSRTLKRDVKNDLDLLSAIAGGLPVEALDVVIADGMFTPQELYKFVMPRRTLAHRRERGQPLTAEESDRLARGVRIAARAEEAIGHMDKARRWLRKSNRALHGERPLDLLGSDWGGRLVESVLRRIEHGLVA